MSKSVLVTGSNGLVGSNAVLYFDNQAYHVMGIDNNMRANFFGPEGDTIRNLHWLKEHTRNFCFYELDIRDQLKIRDLVKIRRPSVIIHCAAQPSHDLAKDRPLEDFHVNAVGTLYLLEAARLYTPESPFIFMSTNKVYGDVPNEVPLIELETRYEYARPEDYYGISEACRIDQSLHSLFGASKVAADILTQEYGRYFNMPTVCFRSGCITGPQHSGVKEHGFLSYLVKTSVRREVYTILGYKGKQVRDQIHAKDVIHAIDAFIQSPRPGEVYNIGGGRENNASILECIDKIESRLDYHINTTYVDKSRLGDHICYISNTSKFKSHYQHWSLTQSIDTMIDELLLSEIIQINKRFYPAIKITN